MLLKKGIKILLIVIAVIVALALAGLAMVASALGKVNEYEGFVQNPEAGNKAVAIILDGSEYKIELAETIAGRLGTDVRVEAYGLQNLRKIDNEDYDAVVVMAPVYVGRLQTGAFRWVNRLKNPDNTILVITSAGNTDCDVPVDTFTTATLHEYEVTSEPVEINEMTTRILTKITDMIN